MLSEKQDEQPKTPSKGITFGCLATFYSTSTIIAFQINSTSAFIPIPLFDTELLALKVENNDFKTRVQNYF